MVSCAGDAAVSGVSLVNMVATIFLYLFTALVSGGAVVVSQHIGSGMDVIGSMTENLMIKMEAVK